jgi:DNA polymerase-3 subunit delta'
LQQVAQGRLPQALIVAAPMGAGKATLIHQFLWQIYAPQRALLKAGSHPNLLWIAREFDEKKQKLARDLGRDDVAPVEKFLQLTAPVDAPRLVVIDGADSMNRTAQNALLKWLEEPPLNTHFILLTNQWGGLLPTIRSRCQRLNLPPLNKDNMDKALDYFLPDLPQNQRDILVLAAQGCVGQALRDHAFDVPQWLRRLLDIVANPDLGEAMQAADDFAKLTDDVQDLLLTRYFLVQQQAWVTQMPTDINAKLAWLHHWRNAWAQAVGFYLDKRTFLTLMLQAKPLQAHELMIA